MSSDNYYIVRKHPKGGYAAVMGFASDDRTPKARKGDEQFATLDSALDWACREYSEYGASIHPECVDPKATTYRVIVHDDSDGLWAEIPELPGCLTQADSLAELWASIGDAASAWLEVSQES